MKLNRIDIRTSETSSMRFHESVQCVPELYLRNLGVLNKSNCRYLNLFYSSKKNEDGKLMKVQNFWDYYTFFDFHLYENLHSKYDKKKIITEHLHESLLKISDLANWEKDTLKKAYKSCEELKYENERMFKNKIFQSPDKQFWIGMLHIHDIGEFEILEVLFDKDKNEIARRKCFQDNVAVFKVDQIKWSKDSKSFEYYFKGPNKIFKSVIKDLLVGKQHNLLDNTSNYFKL
ncbi:MAG: hypothetical protein GY705_00015 [Bacteroidetes bacterium]|nr:hypothetical protein [Bacteroidota bacterium]